MGIGTKRIVHQKQYIVSRSNFFFNNAVRLSTKKIERRYALGFSEGGGIVAVVAASEAAAAPAVAWLCGGGKRLTERRQR